MKRIVIGFCAIQSFLDVWKNQNEWIQGVLFADRLHDSSNLGESILKEWAGLFFHFSFINQTGELDYYGEPSYTGNLPDQFKHYSSYTYNLTADGKVMFLENSEANQIGQQVPYDLIIRFIGRGKDGQHVVSEVARLDHRVRRRAIGSMQRFLPQHDPHFFRVQKIIQDAINHNSNTNTGKVFGSIAPKGKKGVESLSKKAEKAAEHKAHNLQKLENVERRVQREAQKVQRQAYNPYNDENLESVKSMFHQFQREAQRQEAIEMEQKNHSETEYMNSIMKKDIESTCAQQ